MKVCQEFVTRSSFLLRNGVEKKSLPCTPDHHFVIDPLSQMTSSVTLNGPMPDEASENRPRFFCNLLTNSRHSCHMWMRPFYLPTRPERCSREVLEQDRILRCVLLQH